MNLISSPQITVSNRSKRRSRVTNQAPLVLGMLLCGLLIDCETGFAQTKPTKTFIPNRAIQIAARTGHNLQSEFYVEKIGGQVFREEEEFRLKCDIYLPGTKNSAALPQVKVRYPAVVAVHGGAWRSGSKITMLRHANLFAKSGYVVMAVNYRHAPKYPFPAQIHDCKYAVRWLKANAETYHVDPSRIGAFGYSAGGHLVALLGVTIGDPAFEGPIPETLEAFDSSVTCVSAGGAPCEFSWIGSDSQVLKTWLGGTRAAVPKSYENASPLTHVDSKDVPFYFFHGEHDLIVPADSSLKMHDALTNAGVDSSRDVALLSGHLSTFSNMTWAKKSLRFFDKHLKIDDPRDSAKISGNTSVDH